MLTAISITTFFSLLCWWGNNGIVVSRHIYKNNKIPKDFDGFRIVHISDLHNKMFGKEQSVLLKKISDLNPDMVVITGDLIDRRRFNLNSAMYFINEVVNIAPTYYVSGNHEVRSGRYNEIITTLSESDIFIMDNTKTKLFKTESLRKNNFINIIGLADPSFEGYNYSKIQLKKLSRNNKFKILISHRPEIFDMYCESSIDLIFAGHTHGGQFRMPFIGAPHYKYSKNIYSKGKSTMFVSRGLGNSIIPIRIFNRPEIVMVTLKRDDTEL